LGFYVGGGTAAVHTADAGSSPRVRVPLEANFLSFNNFLMRIGDKH